MIKWAVCIMLGVAMAGNALAEFRIWTDKKGNSLEAEFVCENAGRIVLRDREGKDFKLILESLSENDQRYLRSKLPPTISIDFSKTQDRRKQEYYSDVDMQCEVVIKQTSRMPYDGELNRNKEFVMLDRTEKTFNFKDSKSFSFKGSMFRMRQYDSTYYLDDGVEYQGFLVAVYDPAGNVVDVKSSRTEFIENLASLSEFKAGNRFSKDMQQKSNIRTF
jgi:hypothetical protein